LVEPKGENAEWFMEGSLLGSSGRNTVWLLSGFVAWSSSLLGDRFITGKSNCFNGRNIERESDGDILGYFIRILS